MDMLVLLIKLLMISLIALLVVPIGFSVAIYFSLERELLLVGIKIFGANILRLNLINKDNEFELTVNGKNPKSDKELNVTKAKLKSREKNKRAKKNKKLIVKIVMKTIEFYEIECALQFGTNDTSSTAIIVGAIKSMFFPLKFKCDQANLQVFTDWEKEVANLGARIDMSLTLLKLIGNIK